MLLCTLSTQALPKQHRPETLSPSFSHFSKLTPKDRFSGLGGKAHLATSRPAPLPVIPAASVPPRTTEIVVRRRIVMLHYILLGKVPVPLGSTAIHARRPSFQAGIARGHAAGSLNTTGGGHRHRGGKADQVARAVVGAGHGIRGSRPRRRAIAQVRAEGGRTSTVWPVVGRRPGPVGRELRRRGRARA